jgi:hypothetical protein
MTQDGGEIDPDHPFYRNHSPANPGGTLHKYNAGSDIVATDIYPVVPHGIRESYAFWEDGRQRAIRRRTAASGRTLAHRAAVVPRGGAVHASGGAFVGAHQTGGIWC